MKDPICKGCNKTPNELREYIEQSEMERMSPNNFVKDCEGTYNKDTNEFLCTNCYFEQGMPIGNQFAGNLE